MGNLATKRKQHVAMCSLCKHVDCKEIERAYLDGTSPYQIELDYPGVSAKCVYGHAKMLGLDKKRDNSTLTKVRRILDRANVGKLKISEALVGKCLELEAKITGEMVNKHQHEGELKHKHNIENSVKRRLDRIISAIPGVGELDDGEDDDFSAE